MPSRTPSGEEDGSDNEEHDVVTLKEFENNASRILGVYATKLTCKILKKQYGIHLCETSGPTHSELKIVLERLFGTYTAKVILGEQDIDNNDVPDSALNNIRRGPNEYW